MKTIKLLISMLLIAVFAQVAMAKNQKVGLYLTADDYVNHKLSFLSDGSNGTSVKLHGMFGTYKVIVIQDGKKQEFSKSEIFGYRLNDQDFRYFNNAAYRILDTEGFYFYAYSKLMPAIGAKGPKPTELFYFSSKSDNEIKPLTMDNLQAVFTKNTRFLYTVEGFFKSDNELTAFDPNLKEYKLKYLYAQTAK